MGKEVWVISELSEVQDLMNGDNSDLLALKPNVSVYESFERAKEAFRQRIKALSEHYNFMTDEPGHFGFESLIWEPDEGCGEAIEKGCVDLIAKYMTDTSFPKSVEDIKQLVNYENYLYENKEGYESAVLSINFHKDEKGNPGIAVRGWDDGPDNGIDPYIDINCFIMDDPDKKYSFHVDSEFDDAGYNLAYYLDLQKATIE